MPYDRNGTATISSPLQNPANPSKCTYGLRTACVPAVSCDHEFLSGSATHDITKSWTADIDGFQYAKGLVLIQCRLCLFVVPHECSLPISIILLALPCVDQCLVTQQYVLEDLDIPALVGMVHLRQLAIGFLDDRCGGAWFYTEHFVEPELEEIIDLQRRWTLRLTCGLCDAMVITAC
jgi:hypothetical protein